MGAVATRRSLTEKQSTFIDHIVNGVDRLEAARLAGFQFPAQDAYRLSRLPHVVGEISTRRSWLLEAEGGSLAYRTLKECCDPKYPGATRVAAAKVLATMAGMLKAENGIADRKGLEAMTADELEQQLAKIDQALAGKAAAAKPIEGVVRDGSAAS